MLPLKGLIWPKPLLRAQSLGPGQSWVLFFGGAVGVARSELVRQVQPCRPNHGNTGTVRADVVAALTCSKVRTSCGASRGGYTWLPYTGTSAPLTSATVNAARLYFIIFSLPSTA